MIYYHIALNTILPLLTYAYDDEIALGTRVVVKLRGQKQVGIVWASHVQLDIDVHKILPIESLCGDDFTLPDEWRKLVEFTAKYYHYPIGQTAFTALPSALKTTKAQRLPEPILSYTLNDLGKQQTPPPTAHAKKWALWQALLSGCLTLAELKKIHSKAHDLIAFYQQENWLTISSHASPIFSGSHYVLNAEQAVAVEAVSAHLHEFQTFLLHGITGSGKTEVYFDIMAQVLSAGKQVLFMLPEINLTPQLRQRIAQRFPQLDIAILHSQTAAKARADDYLRAMTGQAKLVVGTRLSVFTPLPHLGLVVVDEEHDGSFKQDNDLRYHARDLAIWRAKQSDCPIVLGSATPSLETWHKAQTGAYRLLSLPHRAQAEAKLPSIQMIDVRKIKLEQGFSPQVIQLLQKNYQNGGLSLVYLNRRGFAPALFCGDCGHTFSCPNCSAKLVLHQSVKQLRCHHCDFRQPVPLFCEECGNQDLTAIGFGTQRIEEALKNHFPNAKIARVDRDSTQHKHDWETLYQRIVNQDVDILIGTQMLAKGHDFANLNLIVALNADGSLFSSDFRATERLFAELMQVSGRAGRAQQVGQVYIQSQVPDNPLFTTLKSHDFATFATQELAQRESLALPPYTFQAAVRADAEKMSDAIDFLNEIRDVIAPMLPESVWQMGAVPMLMARLAERERAQIFIESHERVALHRALSLWEQVLGQYRDGKIRWHIDVDTQEV